MAYAPTLTASTDSSVLPNVQVIFTSLAASCVAVNVYRLSDNRTMFVRGGVNLLTAGGAAVVDYEAALDVPSSYRAEMFSDTALTQSLGFTDTASVTLASNGRSYIHQPLDPGVWLSPYVMAGSASSLTRTSNGSTVYPEGAEVGTWIGSGRRGMTDVALTFMTETFDDADSLQAIFGLYGSPQIAVPCIRVPPPMRIPRTFFGALGSSASGAVTETELDVHQLGQLIQFTMSFDEVAPPAPGLIAALLRREDLDAAYATRGAADAAYLTRQAYDTAYALAGTAGT